MGHHFVHHPSDIPVAYQTERREANERKAEGGRGPAEQSLVSKGRRDTALALGEEDFSSFMDDLGRLEKGIPR